MHCETNRAFTINLREEKKSGGVAGSVENIGCDFFFFAFFMLHGTNWLKGLVVVGGGDAEGKG